MMLKELPRYECLKEAAEGAVGIDPRVCELFLNILHTGDVVSRAEAEYLAGHGLSQGRLIILFLLDGAEAGSLRSSDLAERAQVSRATITGLLDALERVGYVVRVADPRDRRARGIRITAKGGGVLRRVRPRLMRWISSAFTVFPPREREQFLRLLRKACEAVARPAQKGARSSHA